MEEDLKHFFAPMIHVPHLLHHHRHAPVATRVHIKELARQILCLIELLASDLGWGGRWEGGMEWCVCVCVCWGGGHFQMKVC